MDDIRPLDHNVYIAAGRVIFVRDDTFDASDPASVTFLLETARTSYTESWDRPPFGDLTVRTVGPLKEGPTGNVGRVSGSMHMGALPDDVREQLRKEFPDRAADI